MVSYSGKQVIYRESWLSYALDFDDEEEPDLGFAPDKDIKPTKRAFEVDFKIFSPSDIQASQDKQINEVSAILGQPSEATAILLRHLRWNKERLIEAYMDNPDKVLETSGLGPDNASPPSTKVVKGLHLRYLLRRWAKDGDLRLEV